MKPVEKVKFIKSDIFDENTKEMVKDYFKGKLDVIISDMAADTTGNKSLDSIRTNQLCAEVINFSKKVLNLRVYWFQNYLWVMILLRLKI